MKSKTETLGAICESTDSLIQTGPFGSQLHQSDYVSDGIPVIMPQDIDGGRVNLGSIARVSEETATRLKRHKLKKHAIVMPRRGAINKRAFIREDEEGYLCGTGCIKIELTNGQLHPRFLYYYLDQPQMVSWIEQHAVGTTMLNLNTKIISNIPIRLPSWKQQCRIADLLGCYDDLIENNRRQMKLLEDAARQLFKEWFVRLRFPGREHTKIKNGVPGGWERKNLGDYAPLNYGKALKESDRVEGDFPVFGSSGEVGSHNEALVKGSGIIVGRKGNVGSVFWCDKPFWPIDTTYYIAPEACDLFLYHTLQHLPFQNSDGAVPGLNRPYAHALKLLVPPKQILTSFLETTAPMFRQANTLKALNEKLTAARDILLPRLMSGEIEV